jgi:hypothetical protein
MPNYIGSPPGCRPECTVSAECPSDKACVNQKCIDPCPGHCGTNSYCKVINHSPICSCNVGFVGDPFTRCYLQRKYLIITYIMLYITILLRKVVTTIKADNNHYTNM